MAKREIRGFTIVINGEHVDDDGYTRCSECNSKTILVSSFCEWQVDREPFKNGEEMEPDDEMLDPVCVGEVSGHFCRQCDILTSMSYNFP